MPKRTSDLVLEDIEVSLAKIQRYLAGVGREGFLSDDKTVDAVVRNLEIIGEAVKSLPAEFKMKYPDMAWAQIAGLRNRIVHDYAGIDLEIIWQIVNISLPLFAERLARITTIDASDSHG